MIHEGIPTGPALPSDPASAQSEITATLQSPAHAYWNQAAPGHLQAVERMEGLFRVVHPEGGQPAPAKSEKPQPKSLAEAHSRGLTWNGQRWIGKDEDDDAGEQASSESTLPPLPGDLKWSESAPAEFKEFTEAVGELGMDAREATGWFQKYVDVLTGSARGANAEPPEQEEVIEQLKLEWESDFEENVRALDLVSKRLPAVVKNALDESGFGNDLRLILRVAELGKLLLEAQKKIDAIQANREGPYWDSNHPEHAAAIQEVTRLFEVVHGKKLVEPA